MTNYVELAVVMITIANVGALWFLDPRKRTLDKYIYWLILPVLDVGAMSMVFGSFVGGLTFGSMLILVFIILYFRYRD